MNKKKTMFFTGIALLIYIGFYTAFSSLGEYKIIISGENRIGPLRLRDKKIWMPEYCTLIPHQIGNSHSYRIDFGGALYFPLIKLDRSLFHKTETRKEALWLMEQVKENEK